MQGPSGARRKVFLLGHEISYSRSPDMHNAAFRALRLDWTYELLDVSPGELAKALGGLRREDVAAAHLPIPYKPAGMESKDGLEPEAGQPPPAQNHARRWEPAGL